MLQAKYKSYLLNFKEPGGTSRGVMLTRKVWFVYIFDDTHPDKIGIGECAPLSGLSFDDMSTFEKCLNTVCLNISTYVNDLSLLNDYPAIQCGIEMAWHDLKNGAKQVWFDSDFTKGNDGIRINGLIWMGKKEEMKLRIQKKLDEGFSCLKLKIGAIHFEDELDLIKSIRKEFNANTLQLRVDANGAFHPQEALKKLNQLSIFDIHSIEQPIKAGNYKAMSDLCAQTPIPIALDEELICVRNLNQRIQMLDTIKPQYIILKSSLVGGFEQMFQWIRLAEARKIGWWITSALESNLGLTAIAQFTYVFGNKLPQGLGTGEVFTNNISSNLQRKGELLRMKSNAISCNTLSTNLREFLK